MHYKPLIVHSSSSLFWLLLVLLLFAFFFIIIFKIILCCFAHTQRDTKEPETPQALSEVVTLLTPSWHTKTASNCWHIKSRCCLCINVNLQHVETHSNIHPRVRVWVWLWVRVIKHSSVQLLYLERGRLVFGMTLFCGEDSVTRRWKHFTTSRPLFSPKT